ncbi:MAG: uncharacterized protein JWM11_3363 [Planctomycetaceae bacterium]|nr:uncharacterized protein [Planctomycetaceae bacterium]
MLENMDSLSGPASDDLRCEVCDPATSPARLQKLWNSRFENLSIWNFVTAEVYETLARRMLGASAPLLALEISHEGLRTWNRHLLLRQLKGLALARTGATEEAQELLSQVWLELQDQSNANEFQIQETLGTLARLSKDRGLATADLTLRRHFWSQACELYSQAYARTNGYWSGINTATLATLLNDPERAERVATQVQSQCLKLWQTEDSREDTYWLLATLGEAALNRKRWDDAESYYRQAGVQGHNRPGDMNSTRTQARLLLEHQGRDASVLNDWLPCPNVAVFAGHMLDRPDRPDERFPARLETAVKAAIKMWLKQNNVQMGFSSAACGADILFQEAIAELGGESYVILPFGADEFIPQSVAILSPEENPSWIRRARDVVRRASRVVRASSSQLVFGSASYDFANQLINGLALIRAGELSTRMLGLAVSDGKPGDGPGGTTSMITRWHQMGIPVSCVDLSVLPADDTAPLAVRSSVSKSELSRADAVSENAAPAPQPESTLMALLFADAKGFGKLSDREAPLFREHFLGRIAQLAKRFPDTIVVRETWGDGLFFAIKSVRASGQFALELSDLVNNTSWSSLGFRTPLQLRIALHAGPVSLGTNPVTDAPSVSGSHVSQAARLEPATPPGQIYASEAFAALAALDGVTELTCHYVEQLSWGKDFGRFPAYIVHRAIR